MRFKQIVTQIKDVIPFQSARSRVVGDERQKKIRDILVYLKEKKRIRDFIETGKLSFDDVIKGIDFYVVCVNTRYALMPLSVTGPYWAEEHKKQHPNVPVVSVDLNLTERQLQLSLVRQLVAILDSYITAR
ncbi:MAG: hypothetical protein WCV80_01550 [Candidatus Paceibacterota bacterium]|jgi:hypothetical protein